jgi:hypothetical protein
MLSTGSRSRLQETRGKVYAPMPPKLQISSQCANLHFFKQDHRQPLSRGETWGTDAERYAYSAVVVNAGVRCTYQYSRL